MSYPRGGNVRGGTCPGGELSGGGNVQGGKCPYTDLLSKLRRRAYCR